MDIVTYALCKKMASGSKGEKGDPGEKGEQGLPGRDGADGVTPNLQVGDVVTLEAGQQASITRRGNDENPIFDFAIPKGDTGKDGIFVGRVDDAPDHAQVVVNDDASPYDLFFENANVSYMGDTYTSLKEKADADIEYLLREIQTQHYEGQRITATNTYQKQVRSAILRGNTEKIQIGKNLFDKTNKIYDGWLYANGDYFEDIEGTFCTTDFIEVKPNADIVVNSGSGYAQYDDNKKCVCNVLYASSTTLSNTKYIRVVFKRTIIDKLQIEYGTVSTDYEEAKYELKSVNLPVLTTTSENLCNNSTLRYDAYLDNNGNISTAYQDIFSEFISINSAKPIYITTWYNTDTLTNYPFYWILEYDKEYKFISKTRNYYPTKPFSLNSLTKHIKIDLGGVLPSQYTSKEEVQLMVSYDYPNQYIPHKTNILSTPKDVELGSVGNVKDELNLVTGELTQRTDIRAYQEGDESNSEVLTDMTNTRYKLPKEVIKTVDLNNQKVYSYDGTTHYTTSSGVEGHLAPILSIDVPTNLPALVSRQRDTIKDLEKENEALKEEVVVVNQQRESGDLELLSSDFDLDFRLMEIEFALDIPIAATFKEVRNMARTPYEMAKILILGGKYERSDMEYKLGKYLERKQITQAQYDELIALMEANELVV